MNNRPDISVILPFYRNPLVREAVESILAQSFRNFELLAIDDCSGNGVADCLADITDPRLRLIRRETNGGENVTRNHGIELARGRYIAFQDHDDISYPERLKSQVQFLDSHPEVLGCGTACHYGEAKVLHIAPVNSRHLRWEMIFNNHVMFPTVMVRTEVARRFPFGDMVATDDYRWLFEVMAHGEFVNLPEVLFHYRMQPTSLSRERADVQMANQDVCRRRFASDIGVDCNEQETLFLRWLGTPRDKIWPSLEHLRQARLLLLRLTEAFLRKLPGEPEEIQGSALSRLRFATTVSSRYGLPAFWNYRELLRCFPLRSGEKEPRLFGKCLLHGLLPKPAQR